MNLRPYQSQTVEDIRASLLAGHRRVVVQSPTGSGKTVVMAELVRSAEAKGHSVLVLAPRRELVRQASEKLTAAGIGHAVLMAGMTGTLYRRVQVVSSPTLHRRLRDGRMVPPTAHLILVDEAHLSICPSIRNILDLYPDAVVAGFTATPARSDGRALGEFYTDLIPGPSVADLTRDGYLVPARYFAPSKPDLDGIRIKPTTKDYDERDLEERLDRPKLVGDTVSNWLRIAADRKTVVFAATIRHSIHLRDRFREAGIAAEHLDGDTPTAERDDILRRLRTGEVKVVTNCAVLSYGWDEPSISCAVLARPTKSLVLYLQTVGRVLRPCDGKLDAIVLDHGGVVDELGLVDEPIPWSLTGKGRVQERRQQQKKREANPITCPECKVVYTRRADCPECGHRMERKGDSVNFVDGDLAEVSRTQRRNARTFTLPEKAAFFGQLVAVAEERGYKQGWAAWKFREKFGVWPNHPTIRNAEPQKATREVRSWLRGLAIRDAKRREMEAA